MDLDEEDERIIKAALLLAPLLGGIRNMHSQEKLVLHGLQKARLIIGRVVSNYVSGFAGGIGDVYVELKDGAAVSLAGLQNKKFLTEDGQSYSFDELMTPLCDAIRPILAECVNEMEPATANAPAIGFDDIGKLHAEINLAVYHRCLVVYWQDCVANGFGLHRRPDGMAFVPSDPRTERARAASIYRRGQIESSSFAAFRNRWLFKMTSQEKRELSLIPSISRITISKNTVTDIVLSNAVQDMDAALIGTWDRSYVERSYYKELLNESLENFNGLRLSEIALVWQFIQMIAATLLDTFRKMPASEDAIYFDALAPKIPRKTLIGTVARALNMPKKKAEELIGIFIYRGGYEQDLWAQPLFAAGDNVHLLLPAVHSIHFIRVVETWMKQGKLDLDKRGEPFERYCKESLSSTMSVSSIRQGIQLVDEVFKYSAADGSKVQIDLVIVIGQVILIGEAKCILWPDDARQFLNYRKTIEGAVTQVLEIKAKVEADYTRFVAGMNQLEYTAPEHPQLVPCVLTNSAIYAGFPLRDVAVIDLDILMQFFRNGFARAVILEKGEAKALKRMSIYEEGNVDDAAAKLEAYLLAPPQLHAIKDGISTYPDRETV